MTSVAVTSRSFSNHPLLRAELSKRYQHVSFNEAGKTLSGEELIQFLQAHDRAIIGLECLNAEILAQLPKLKIVSRFGVGLDTLDLPAMQSRGIRLAYTAGANKRAVAELVIGLAITMLRQLANCHQDVLAGRWKQIKGQQLSDRVVGIIGLGAIGKDLALLLKAFNCVVCAFDCIDHSVFCQQYGIQQMELEPLLKLADIVSLHLPLNSHTQFILNAQRLSLMKPSALLINTARGGLVDEEALKSMLMNHQIAGAAFDVFACEPPSDLGLLSLQNFFATPHIGGSTEEAILAMGYAAIDGLELAEDIPLPLWERSTPKASGEGC